jgi:hypothetical protein
MDVELSLGKKHGVQTPTAAATWLESQDETI